MKLAVRLVNNHLTDKDIKLLKLEEKKRDLYNRIKNNTDLDQDEKQELFQEYKQVKQEIKDIAYNSAGLFNDAEYSHLLKGGKLNLDLLEKWRDDKVEEMTAEELTGALKEMLKPKEFAVFTKFNVEDESYTDIADELDISKGYSYDLGSRARRKIEEEYDLGKVIEKLKQDGISEAPKKDKSEEPIENKAQDQEDQNEDAAEELLIALDDDLADEDIREIIKLMFRIEGIITVTTADDKVDIDEIEEEVMTVFKNLKEAN